MNTVALALVHVWLSAAPPAALAGLPRVGDEVDVTAGAVTALSCALAARDRAQLGALTSCSYAEAKAGIVVYDVAERLVYRLAGKRVALWQLESAFGGGSVDLIGKVVQVDRKSGVVVVDVEELTVTPKPKAGSFKGCL
ncbi:MAG: hypothetical protein IT383_27895 [Deltaproteobacteria bacterium]|nr:hypothetical protein [Deltaproteobacteria bacterium]